MSSTGQSKSNPLVSVIIPAYNQGPMLASAIDSALAQTYPNVEVVVVNDGSTDPITRETAERYEGRIVYLEHENRGVAAARNTGIEASKGELIAFLDQDDRWLPNRLEVTVKALQSHPDVALVHSSYYYIDAEGQRTGVARLPEGEWQPLPRLLVEMPVSPCTMLFRRQLMTETGPLDTTLKGSDEWYWCLLLGIRGHRFYCVSEPLAEYRRHAGNTSRRPELMIPIHLRMFDKFYALPELPASVLRWKKRTYFGRHTLAAAMYYGAGSEDKTREHMQAAMTYYPEGLATGRFLQSLIYSKSPQPSYEVACEAIRFVQNALVQSHASPALQRKLQARAQLVLALHSRSGIKQRLYHVARAVAADPALIADHELWSAGRRLLGRSTARLRRTVNSQMPRVGAKD